MLSKEKHRVLDFGCGNGVMLPTLSGISRSVVGIDLHTTAAARMKLEYGLRNVFLVTANGIKLPFKDDLFDTVVATSSLEHLKDLNIAVEEIARVIKPGGFLLFLSPTENIFYRFGRWLFGCKKPEDHYYSAGDIAVVLEKFFTVEVEKYLPVGFLPFISAYRIGRFRKADS
jgi:ubiquinone/menaquinone biosynthesis C-methylase UbiE